MRRLAPSLAWLLPLLGLIALVGWDARARIGRSLELSSRYGVAVRAPALDPSSPTGYALQRRSLLTPVLAPDALHWVMQAQDSAATGDTRLRWVNYDNAPTGRAVHWAAPYRWWLLTLAAADHAVFDTPRPLAIERASLWSGPVMLVVFLVLLVPFVASRMGSLAAVLLALGLVGCSPFAVHFISGNADHHAPVIICMIFTVLPLVTGRRVPEKRIPLAHVTSALAGALGLWLSAASMIPVLTGIGLGAVAAHVWMRRVIPHEKVDGTPWRWWGAVGGVASLLAYLIEYAPNNFSWRLEVIHPLYTLAWVAGGELLCRITGHERHMDQGARIRVVTIWTLAACAIALPGMLILTLGTRVFLPADPFLLSLHTEYIAEFQSLASFLSSRPIDLDLIGRLAPVVLFVLTLGFVARRNTSATLKQGLALAAGPALVMLLLANGQIRWWGPASALCLIAVAVACEEARTGKLRWSAAAAALALLSPGLIVAARTAAQAGAPTETDVRRLAERDLAHRLRLRAGLDPLVIAATPDETTSLIYFAGARGLGTMYWENVDGLKTISAILGASTPEIAHDHVRRAEVTHFVLFPWDPSDANCVRLHRGLPPDATVPSDAFAVALKQGRVPTWLKPIPHRLPDHPLLRDQIVRVYEVTAERSPERVAIDAAVYLMDMGRSQEAAALEPVLAGFPKSLAAQATLAGMQARRKEARAFGATLQRILALLPPRDAMPLDDHVRIVMALAIGGQEVRAREELRRALAAADERAVRRLSAGALSDLLELTSALDVTWPEPGLMRLARDLDPGGRP